MKSAASSKMKSLAMNLKNMEKMGKNEFALPGRGGTRAKAGSV
jgi:hypothetical protein